jgi:hypothetical protein
MAHFALTRGGGRVLAAFVVGPGWYYSPRHGTALYSRNDGLKSVG